MEIYDILLSDNHDETRKGFNIKLREKAIRMAGDMLVKRAPLVDEYAGGRIAVYEKNSNEIIWESAIEKLGAPK